MRGHGTLHFTQPLASQEKREKVQRLPCLLLSSAIQGNEIE
jgi:hypothetical protein